MIYDFVQSVNTVCVCVYYLLPCARAVVNTKSGVRASKFTTSQCTPCFCYISKMYSKSESTEKVLSVQSATCSLGAGPAVRGWQRAGGSCPRSGAAPAGAIHPVLFRPATGVA